MTEAADLVSVVIPCRNEVKSIANTVYAILAGHHQNIEILVVDGMSEDGTRAVLEQLEKEDPRVRMIDNPKRLTPFAFNLGVRNAKGDYVQIVGSRNVLSPDYIPLLVAKLIARPDVGCVGGDYQHVFDSAAGRYISLAMESKFGVGGGNYRTMSDDTFVDTVGIPLYRRNIFADVGYFDETLTRNQDDDFNFRVSQRGYKIMYVHAAKATYLVRGSYRKAFQQFRQYGYFKVFVNKKHHAVTTLRQLVPAAFVGFWVMALPLSLFVPAVQALCALVALLYLVAGLLLAGRKLNLFDRLRVVTTCLVLHLGYGIGYWQGIWDFLLLNNRPSSKMQQQTT